MTALPGTKTQSSQQWKCSPAPHRSVPTPEHLAHPGQPALRPASWGAPHPAFSCVPLQEPPAWSLCSIQKRDPCLRSCFILVFLLRVHCSMFLLDAYAAAVSAPTPRFGLGSCPSPEVPRHVPAPQLQGGRLGLREAALLKLQSQVVDANGGHRGHAAAFSWLCCACRGGAVQDKPHHDDGEGQDVEY